MVLPGALTHLHKPRGAAGIRIETLGKRLKQQLRRPSPQIVDHHIDALLGLPGKCFADRIVALRKRNHAVQLLRCQSFEIAPRGNDALGAENAARPGSPTGQPRRLRQGSRLFHLFAVQLDP